MVPVVFVNVPKLAIIEFAKVVWQAKVKPPAMIVFCLLGCSGLEEVALVVSSAKVFVLESLVWVAAVEAEFVLP